MTRPSFLSALSTPSWRRTLYLRRGLAGLLLLLAGAVYLVGSSEDTIDAVVATGQVSAGSTIESSQVEIRSLPAQFAPSGALRGAAGLETASGSVATATLDAGEVITAEKLLGQPSITALFPPGHPPVHLVPVNLTDDEAVRLLRHGDEVSVVTTQDPSHASGDGAHGPGSQVISDAAVVVLAGSSAPSAGGPKGTGKASAAVLLALPPAEASEVAAAALTSPLAVVLTGERTRT
ncbi:hypothetical protein CATYP_03335 [Corynebacterium atypicum]|uniref:SAF domain-containing protein n=1 Tax=Corynebacterium atypicum TaxID=191610 RepID=A0ABN4DBT7_9CORY|nr:SAF domain-containing protein [Corynebacterium atypicum]AIG63864.1 hypothetical protein CATYP_03335 [Corynebacterium atypicum]